MKKKDENIPSGVSAVAEHNVDSVDYFSTLSADEKKEVANGLQKSTKTSNDANSLAKLAEK